MDNLRDNGVFGSHVPGIAKVDTALIGALIGAVLQAYHSLSGLQLLVAEVPDVGLRLLGSDAVDAVFGRLAAQRLQAYLNGRQILLFPEIDSLEELFGGNA